MTSNPPILEICFMCQHVRDDRAWERWITQQSYREEMGIDPTDCPLTFTYCPSCYKYIVNAIKAA
jgi:hypothetical protein